MDDLPAAQGSFRLAEIAPAVARPLDVDADGRRHPDSPGAIGRSRLDQAHGAFAVLAEAPRQHAAGRPRPDDDIIVASLHDPTSGPQQNPKHVERSTSFWQVPRTLFPSGAPSMPRRDQLKPLAEPTLIRLAEVPYVLWGNAESGFVSDRFYLLSGQMILVTVVMPPGARFRS